MEQLTSDLIILEDGQTPPAGILTPPRKPSWFDTLNYIRNPDQFCRQNWQKYGPIFTTGIFGKNTVLVGTAKANQMIFNGDLKYSEISLPATTMEMFGEYSLFQRPDLHRQRKSALRPGFTGQMLEGYLPHINEVILQGIAQWPTPGNLGLYSSIEKICFEILVPILLGIRLDESDPKNFEGLPISSQTELKKLYKTYFDGFYGLVKWKSSLTAFGRGFKARTALLEFVRAVIQKRLSQDQELDPTADFLSMMLASRQADSEGVFSPELMENQCLLQLWASHYEITGLVASLIYQMGRYPEVLDPLRQEQLNIAGEVSHFSSEQLKQMVFLDATIKETLRTLPPSSTASRQLTKSVILDGVLYQKGTVIIAEPRISHILPEHFGHPEKFDPNRFLPPRNEGKLYEYIPFGGGVHACLGAQIAMVVSKVFAAHILQKFDWKLTGKAKFVKFPLNRIQSDYCIEMMSR
jgi:cytochrome P450